MKNKKKKQLPLLLLALLFITAAAYGTRAYFTDQATQNAGISLQVGNLSIDKSDVNAVLWTYTPLDGSNPQLQDIYNPETKKIDNPSEIIKVQPGDAFTGTFTFKNTGSLTQKVTADNDLVVENGNDIFKITVGDTLTNNTTAETGNSVLVGPNDTVSIEVVVTVDGLNIENAYNDSHNSRAENLLTDDKVALTAIQGAITVTAVQINVE